MTDSQEPEAPTEPELALYKCHKEVRAFKIVKLMARDRTDNSRVLVGDDGVSARVDREWLAKHNPPRSVVPPWSDLSGRIRRTKSQSPSLHPTPQVDMPMEMINTPLA